MTDVVGDAVTGGLTAGAAKGGGAVLSKVAKSVAPKAARALGKIRSLTSEKVFQKQYKQLGQAARKANPCNCFGAGTLVWTSDGLRPIEQLHVGDQVLSWNEETGEVALQEVTETFETPHRPLIDLIAESSVSRPAIAVTPGHPFWVEGTGWVHAGALTQRDVLWGIDLVRAADASHGLPVAESRAPGPFEARNLSRRGGAAEPRLGTVYNLTVAEFHTYFVGLDGVLVHNALPCAGAGELTSRAARRQVMREQGIPTSQQPASQSRNASGWAYEYEVPKPGGGTAVKSVQQQTLDSSHPGQGHWEAGNVKTDPISGEVRANVYGRSKLTNDKSKANYQ